MGPRRTRRSQLLDLQRRLDAAEREGLVEGVEGNPQADARRKHVRPSGFGAVELFDRRQPVDARGVDASEQCPVLKYCVDTNDTAVERDLLFVAVESEQASDAIAAQQTERFEHQLRIACRLDDEV